MTIKERPILMNGDMVRAVLAGKKTQTRRPVQAKKCDVNQFDAVAPIAMQTGLVTASTLQWNFGSRVNGRVSTEFVMSCPLGVVGDRLWVREAFTYCVGGDYDEYELAREFTTAKRENRRPKDSEVYYRATDKTPPVVDLDGDEVGWTPSIHMPRWASRITLEITDVRVERVQEISEEDAIAEGCCTDFYPDGTPVVGHSITEFAKLWCSIYGVDSWTFNPWVWVITFKQIKA